MKTNQKIKLNISEMQCLIVVFGNYPISQIKERNTRLMVSELLIKFGKKLMGLILTGGKERIVSLSKAQAAAFDEAFRQTPTLEHAYKLGVYEETLVNRILNEINRVL